MTTTYDQEKFSNTMKQAFKIETKENDPNCLVKYSEGINTPNEVQTFKNDPLSQSQNEYLQLPLKKKRRTRSDKGKKHGIKYDENKPKIAEMFISFAEPLKELCKVYEFGFNKYGKDNWKELNNGKQRYLNAFCRHMLKSETEKIDPETGYSHLAHCCFNALAALYFEIKESKNDNI